MCEVGEETEQSPDGRPKPTGAGRRRDSREVASHSRRKKWSGGIGSVCSCEHILSLRAGERERLMRIDRLLWVAFLTSCLLMGCQGIDFFSPGPVDRGL